MQFFSSNHLRRRDFLHVDRKNLFICSFAVGIAWTDVNNETNINIAMIGVFRIYNMMPCQSRETSTL